MLLSSRVLVLNCCTCQVKLDHVWRNTTNKLKNSSPNITKLVKDKKSSADILEEFTHPCGGSGWKLAIYHDFRNPDTPCLPGLQQTMYSERPYTCREPTASDAACVIVNLTQTALEFSKVCGRIKAYQFGTAPLSYIQVNAGLEPLWTFTAGVTKSQADPSLISDRCPCDGGVPFPNEHYFCESLIEEDTPGNKYDNHFFHNEVLWDKAGCSSSGDCCSRFDSPYFILHLPHNIITPIYFIICNFGSDSFAIELIEFYVK